MATYTIDSVQDLIDLTLLSGKFAGKLWKDNLFNLTTNLDLTGVDPLGDGTGWFPIGTWDSGSWFNGFFDGLGHTISNMTINRVADHQGLFGSFDGDAGSNVDACDNASVTNAGGFVLITQATKFQDTRPGMLINVTNWNGGTYSTGFSYVTARTDDSVTLDLAYVDAVVSGVKAAVGTNATPNNNPVKNLGLINVNITANTNVGGMVGSTLGPGIVNDTPIKNCYVTGVISATGTVGGFLGFSNNGYCKDCWADVDITVTTLTGVLAAGGFVATDAIGTDCVNCYSLGSVTLIGDAADRTFMGGFIGDPDFTQGDYTSAPHCAVTEGAGG